MLDSRADGGARQIFNDVPRSKYRDGVATITFLSAISTFLSLVCFGLGMVALLGTEG